MGVNDKRAAARGHALVVLALLLVGPLTGCGGEVGAAGAGVASEAASGAPEMETPTPTPSSTLTAEEQEAFEQATQTALAYTQTIADLYTGARTDLNDMYLVATGDLVQREMRNVAVGLAQGVRSVPEGFQLKLASAEAVKVRLKTSPPQVIVAACIDATAGSDIAADGTTSPGVREVLNYYVVQMDHLPSPGWAVRRITGEPKPEDRSC